MKLFFSLLIFVLLPGGFSFAQGVWIGSGGELVKDSRNPWFVHNTKQVSWCLQIDATAVSVTEAQIEAAFNDALTFWKDEFRSAEVFQPAEGSFTLGWQQFTKKKCTEPGIDVRILFGSSLLNKVEIEFLKDPNKFVGVTVRTDYDAVNLRGKGFLFFSGDLKQGKTPLIERAWEKEKILRYALKHELGHVFGMPHVGAGLMSEIFLDQIMKPEYISIFENAQAESFLSPNLNFTACGMTLGPATRQFFGSPPNHDCLVVERVQGLTLRLKISSLIQDSPVTATELGTLQMEAPDLQDFAGKPASFMHLTEEQVVFTPKERAYRLFLIGPMAQEYGAKGVFIPRIPGPPKTVYMRVSPQGINIIGTLINGKIAPILQYNSPLSLIYILNPGP